MKMVNWMNFDNELKSRVEHIEKIIAEFLPEEKGWQKSVIEAMNYSVLAGGKRLRPMLMEETYRFFGGTRDVVKPFMAAIEMIHTYSLVHDDLPAMDNDEYRRGRKTTHVVYGEAMAILAGDGLLNYAFETAVKAFEMVDPKDILAVSKALSILARKAGIYGMIGGQTADIEAFLDEMLFQKRVEFWGEGILLYDYKRLGKGILRGYHGTNEAAVYAFNCDGRSPQWNIVLTNGEFQYNMGIDSATNNPDPSGKLVLWTGNPH